MKLISAPHGIRNEQRHYAVGWIMPLTESPFVHYLRAHHRLNSPPKDFRTVEHRGNNVQDVVSFCCPASNTLYYIPHFRCYPSTFIATPH